MERKTIRRLHFDVAVLKADADEEGVGETIQADASGIWSRRRGERKSEDYKAAASGLGVSCREDFIIL